MKVLLLGEYSNVHWTLAQGLRQLNCDVTVASSGDRFKNYQRDINLYRNSNNITDSIKYVSLIIKHFQRFKGYDIVQIINPFFLDLRAERNLQAFHYLKKHNGKVFMGAFGDDSYWLRACLDKKTFRYSEFNIPERKGYLPAAQQLIQIWSDKDKTRINTEIAEKSDGIIACLYEYYAAYLPYFNEKLTYIPEPVNTDEIQFSQRGLNQEKSNYFIGIQKLRSEIKGTDIMYKVLKQIEKKYSDQCQIIKAESVPYHEYINLMSKSDILLDQLYSYTPGMNALTAMAQGLVVVGGGEPEMYELLDEKENKPVINVIPDEKNIYLKLEYLIQNKEQISKLSLDSFLFVQKHHNYIKVAQRYLDTWNK